MIVKVLLLLPNYTTPLFDCASVYEGWWSCEPARHSGKCEVFLYGMDTWQQRTLLQCKLAFRGLNPKKASPVNIVLEPLVITTLTLHWPKSDQFHISPAALPEILHCTVWRTWLFIAYSNERWSYYQLSLPHFYISPRLGECTVRFELGSDRAEACKPCGLDQRQTSKNCHAFSFGTLWTRQMELFQWIKNKTASF